MNFVNRNVGVPDSAVLDHVVAQPQPARQWAFAYRSIELTAIVADVVAIFAASILSGAIYHYLAIGRSGDILYFAGTAAVVAALFVAIAKNYEFYKPMRLLTFKAQLRNVILIWSGVFLFFAGLVFSLKIGKEFSRGTILLFAITGFLALCGLRVFWRLFIARGLESSKFSGRSVVLISDPATSSDLELFNLLTRHGLRLKRHFTLPAQLGDFAGCQEAIRQVIAFVRGSEIEEIVVGADLSHWDMLDPLLSELRVLPLPVNVVPVGSAAKLFALPSHAIGETPSVEIQRGPLSAFERVSKRALDIFGATVGLILLLPLLVVTALAIKIDTPGPIFFRQRRGGFNGKQFQILKFRTMKVLEDGDAITQAARHDDRITRVGTWLRRTSIDELPQFFNVLRGHMSLVGPRPHAVAHDNEFYKAVENYAFRHHVKPGLTGWAQVHGYRGETPTPAQIQGRVQLDLWYIENWSLGLDLSILARTTIEVLRAQNAY